MFYGWFIAALGALIIALGSAPVFYGLPVWNPVLRNAFSWSATQMSGAYAITQVQEGFLGPVAGFLTEKLGPRRMVLIGMVVLGLGFVLFSRIQELWQFYAAFCIMSLGSSLGTWLPVMTALNYWFVRNKSRAMSLGMEGFALGESPHRCYWPGPSEVQTQRNLNGTVGGPRPCSLASCAWS